MTRAASTIVFSLSLLIAGCGSNPVTGPVDPGPCTFSVTMSAPGFGTLPVAIGESFAPFFASNVLPTGSAVYFVDVNASPAGCGTLWTAVSADTSAVQVSPASGHGVGRVEIFIPQSTGAARATTLAIAGSQTTVTQSGR
jgi:hypothetical protein